MCCSDTGSCCPLLGCRELLMLTCSFQGEKNKLNKIQINEKWFLCRNKLHLHSPQGGSSTGCVCVCLQSNCVGLCCTARWHKAFLCQSAGGPTVCVACCSLVHAYMRTCVSHWCRSLETLSASGLGGWTEAPRHSAAVKWAIVLLMLRRAVTQTWGGNGLLKYMQSTTRCLWSPGNSTGPTVHAGILLNIQAFSLRCSRRSEHSLCMFQITYNKCRVIVGAISIGGILFSYVLMFINVSSSCHVGRVWPTNYNPEIFKLKA